MKFYCYTVTQLGLGKLPPGELRLAGFERTENPSEADCFVVPCDIRYLSDKQIRALPYLNGNESRHVMFANSEQPKRYLGIPAIIFRGDVNKDVMRRDPTTVPWSWPVDDLKVWSEIPASGFLYDVCFVGWNSTPLTMTACESVKRHAGLKSYFQLNTEFYGTWETNQETDKLKYYRHLFLSTMKQSRLSLCARSIPTGVTRYRFYEALSMARIPVHFNDNAALPFADRIDWDRCSIHIPEKDAERCGEILRVWLDSYDDTNVIARGEYGRAMWERYLDGRKWDDLFAEVVRERLNADH